MSFYNSRWLCFIAWECRQPEAVCALHPPGIETQKAWWAWSYESQEFLHSTRPLKLWETLPGLPHLPRCASEVTGTCLPKPGKPGRCSKGLRCPILHGNSRGTRDRPLKPQEDAFPAVPQLIRFICRCLFLVTKNSNVILISSYYMESFWRHGELICNWIASQISNIIMVLLGWSVLAKDVEWQPKLPCKNKISSLLLAGISSQIRNCFLDFFLRSFWKVRIQFPSAATFSYNNSSPSVEIFGLLLTQMLKPGGF